MLAIRLPAAIEKRLEKLAKRTGRTKTYYAREAILQHLEDMEDIHLAEQAYARYLKGQEKTIPLEKIKIPLRSLEGLLEDMHIDITEADIAQARREMWGNSPRDIS